ncbi:YbjN domain-containing protein [Brevundimonas sp.]|uniref:YbjN domain-containing protein n=1 Tax=Brevundimonas sp. TaxID=1871086 RepID=UPI0025C63ECC|nr:YbjN domain-containing protein [Brevundimonas sp.]
MFRHTTDGYLAAQLGNRVMKITAILSLSTAAALLAAYPSGVTAQDARGLERTVTATVFRSLSAAEVSDVLGRQGYKSVEKKSETEFSITTTSGFRFRAQLMACDVEGHPPGCLGLMLRAAWIIEDGNAPKVTPVVADFNSRFRIGKALIEDDSVYLERYVITDGGVTLDHIGEEVDEFLGSADALRANLFDALK